jgi:hypothetical protein
MSLHTRPEWVKAAVAVLFLPHPMPATEKHWIAHEAHLIVVGALHPDFSFPWFDGWHTTGTIAVDEVLYGFSPSDPIEYRFVWTCGGLFWWPPRYTGQLKEKGLWFLRPAAEHTWTSSGGCPDVGFRSLSERGDFGEYIRLYKH